MIFEGMRIKTFPDTDIIAYTNLIEENGFSYKIYRDSILVGKKIRPEYDKVKIGKVLRWAREKAGWDKKRIATRLWVTPTVINNWENGRTLPRKDDLLRYCKIVGIDAEKLLRDTEIK